MSSLLVTWSEFVTFTRHLADVDRAILEGDTEGFVRIDVKKGTAEAIRQLGDAYNRTRLTPFVKGLFRKWLSWGH